MSVAAACSAMHMTPDDSINQQRHGACAEQCRRSAGNVACSLVLGWSGSGAGTILDGWRTGGAQWTEQQLHCLDAATVGMAPDATACHRPNNCCKLLCMPRKRHPTASQRYPTCAAATAWQKPNTSVMLVLMPSRSRAAAARMPSQVPTASCKDNHQCIAENPLQRPVWYWRKAADGGHDAIAMNREPLPRRCLGDERDATCCSGVNKGRQRTRGLSGARSSANPRA